MQIKQTNTFVTIRTEGAILPSDMLQRIDAGDLEVGGLKPEDYGLTPNERLTEAATRSWSRLTGLWQTYREHCAQLPERDLGTTLTRDRWLLPLFQELGYDRLPVQRAVEIEGKSYPISHGWQHAPIHLISYKLKLDDRKAGVAGAARISPHGLVQEYLNRSDDHLWGFLTNGLRLRILRDNASLTRPAYVEFDLEAMMDGDVYSDFLLLWLLCHASRVASGRPDECQLERWSRKAQDQGARALDQLRGGVEQAISALGTGFLAHPVNTDLRDQLRDGTLPTQDYYRQLLRLVYRMLFLFVSEDRGVLIDPVAPTKAFERYRDYYSTARLRRLAERRTGTRHADLYYPLRLVMDNLGSVDGCPGLGLPALGGFLFSREAISDVADAQIANHDLLDAIRALAFTQYGQTRRPVDYRNLGSEELGSVYESLLELHPVLNLEAATFSLETAGGNERKTTGSYYTPTSLIQCLLESTLDPVLDEACAKADPVQAILDLRICDPACGSGHFLIAAAHRVAKRLASARTGDDEPSPEARQSALRSVIGHCIYGVDINPMSVELCKVNLWLESVEPGKPLSFLDPHIQCGNSLLGTTPALIAGGIPNEAFKPIEGDDKAVCTEQRKRNQAARRGQGELFTHELLPSTYGQVAHEYEDLSQIGDDTADAVREQMASYEHLLQSEAYSALRTAADAWCAAFVWRKTASSLPFTENEYAAILDAPLKSTRLLDEVRRLAKQFAFFHWHVAFPDVFTVSEGKPKNEKAGWSGGFDVVIGNPPWEHAEMKEKEWFAARRPDIAEAKTGAIRKAMIARLTSEDPAMYDAYTTAKRRDDSLRHYAGNSDRYPLMGRGRINLYTLFTELMRNLINPTGRVGCIVPSGIATDDTTKFFFQDLTEKQALASLYDFENRKAIFPAVHRSYKFCLLTLTGTARPATNGADFVFFAQDVSELDDGDRPFTLSAEDIALLNPNTKTCPIFRSKRDAELTKAIYRRVPVLIKEGPPEENPWGIKFRQGLFNMTSDSHLFHTRVQLEEDGWRLEGNVFRRCDDTMLPLYEAKMAAQYDHRAANVVKSPDATTRQNQPEAISDEEHRDPHRMARPFYWVPSSEVMAAMSTSYSKAVVSVTNVTSASNSRTYISTILPHAGYGHSMLLVIFEGKDVAAVYIMLFEAVVSSYVFDFVARQKLGGLNMGFFIQKQLPIHRPDAFSQNIPWSKSRLELKDWIIPRVLELSYTAWDLEQVALGCDHSTTPFRWNEDRRFLLLCELDAAFFHLYGIKRDDMDYIMETFPIVKRKDVAKHGDFRTKLVILDIYDRMQEAIDTGEPYQTFLDPPPADPSVAHPTPDGRRYVPTEDTSSPSPDTKPVVYEPISGASDSVTTSPIAKVADKADIAPSATAPEIVAGQGNQMPLWSGDTLPDPATATTDTLIDHLVALLAELGPLSIEDTIKAYLKAIGVDGAPKKQKGPVNNALAKAVLRGKIRYVPETRDRPYMERLVCR
jgi:hypothetical protein